MRLELCPSPLSKLVPGRQRGEREYVVTHLPFSAADLVIWKRDTPTFRSDPQTVIQKLKTIVDSQNRSWEDTTQLIQVFLMKDEQLKLFEKSEEIAKRPVICVPGQRNTAWVAWPQECPNWDYNDTSHWDTYTSAKANLLEALEEIGKKPLNWSEFQRTTQRETENLDAFWVCLSEAAVMFAHLDLSCQKDQKILASTFVDQSAATFVGPFREVCLHTTSIDFYQLPLNILKVKGILPVRNSLSAEVDKEETVVPPKGTCQDLIESGIHFLSQTGPLNERWEADKITSLRKASPLISGKTA
ncbi:hypothetical protein L345_11436, partial [Ophiophagus hannah]